MTTTALITTTPTRASLVALALVVILSATVAAQDSTTLGRWVRSQPREVQHRIGCDLPVPYSRQCWEPVFVGGRRVATIWYRQTANGIVVTTQRHGR